MTKVNAADATFDKFNRGTSKLDEVLSLGQTSGHGLGYVKGNTTFQNPSEMNYSFINFTKEGSMEKHSKSKVFVCHYCNKVGHIKPFCKIRISDEKGECL